MRISIWKSKLNKSEWYLSGSPLSSRLQDVLKIRVKKNVIVEAWIKSSSIDVSKA